MCDTYEEWLYQFMKNDIAIIVTGISILTLIVLCQGIKKVVDLIH